MFDFISKLFGGGGNQKKESDEERRRREAAARAQQQQQQQQRQQSPLILQSPTTNRINNAGAPALSLPTSLAIKTPQQVEEEKRKQLINKDGSVNAVIKGKEIEEANAELKQSASVKDIANYYGEDAENLRKELMKANPSVEQIKGLTQSIRNRRGELAATKDDIGRTAPTVITRQNTIQKGINEGKSIEDIATQSGLAKSEVQTYIDSRAKGYKQKSVGENLGDFGVDTFKGITQIIRRPIATIDAKLNEKDVDAALSSLNESYLNGAISQSKLKEEFENLTGDVIGNTLKVNERGIVKATTGEQIGKFAGQAIDAGVNASDVIPVAGGVGTAFKGTAKGVTKDIVKQSLVNNAKQAAVLGTAATGADIVNERGVSPTSLALNYGAPLAVGMGSELGARAIRSGGSKIATEIINRRPENMAKLSPEVTKYQPEIDALSTTLDSISDPKLKRATQKQLNAVIDSQNAAQRQAIRSITKDRQAGFIRIPGAREAETKLVNELARTAESPESFLQLARETPEADAIITRAIQEEPGVKAAQDNVSLRNDSAAQAELKIAQDTAYEDTLTDLYRRAKGEVDLETAINEANPNLKVDKSMSPEQKQVTLEQAQRQQGRVNTDTGEKMFGSRKDMAAMNRIDRSNLSAVERQGERVAAKMVTKQRVLGDDAKYTVNRAADPSVEYAKSVYLGAIPGKPAASKYGTPEQKAAQDAAYRAQYVDEIPGYAAAIRNAQSIDEIIAINNGFYKYGMAKAYGAKFANMVSRRSTAARLATSKYNPKTDFSWAEKKAVARTVDASKPKMHDAELKEYQRVGGNQLDAMSAEEARDMFKFKGLEYGNYVKDNEAAEHLTRFAEAMSDLGTITNMDISQLIEKMDLGIAFGARGKGKAMAHYEGDTKVINITKKKGADGTLSHEFAHALDDFLAGADRRANDYASSGRGTNPVITSAMRDVMRVLKTGGNGSSITVGVNPKAARYSYGMVNKMVDEGKNAQEIIDSIMERYPGTNELTRNRVIQSILRKTGAESVQVKSKDSQFFADSKATGAYWARETEMFARAFADYLRTKAGDTGVSNNYLNHTDQKIPLMSPPHMNEIEPAMDNLMAAIKEEYNIADAPAPNQSMAVADELVDNSPETVEAVDNPEFDRLRLDDLTPVETSLKDSINTPFDQSKAKPIKVDQHGQILDGHNRYNAAKKAFDADAKKYNAGTISDEDMIAKWGDVNFPEINAVVQRIEKRGSGVFDENVRGDYVPDDAPAKTPNPKANDDFKQFIRENADEIAAQNEDIMSQADQLQFDAGDTFDPDSPEARFLDQHFDNPYSDFNMTPGQLTDVVTPNPNQLTIEDAPATNTAPVKTEVKPPKKNIAKRKNTNLPKDAKRTGQVHSTSLAPQRNFVSGKNGVEQVPSSNLPTGIAPPKKPPVKSTATPADAPKQKKSRLANRTVPKSEVVSKELRAKVKATQTMYTVETEKGRFDDSLKRMQAEGADKFADRVHSQFSESLEAGNKKTFTSQELVDGETAASYYDVLGDEASLAKATNIYSAMSKSVSRSGQEVQVAAALSRRTPEGLRYQGTRQLSDDAEAYAKTRKGRKEAKRTGRDVSKPDPETIKQLTQFTDKVKNADKAFADAQAAYRANKTPDNKAKMEQAQVDKDIARDNVQYHIASNVKSATSDLVVNFWRAGLLTSPRTTFGAILSGVGETIQRKLWTDPIATMYDMARVGFSGGDRAVMLPERGSTRRGAKAGFKNATSKQYWKTGKDDLNGMNNENQSGSHSRQLNYGKGRLGRATTGYVNGVYRLMGAADQPFRYATYDNVLSSLAKTEAHNKGFKGAGREQHIREFMENPPEWARERALNEALDSTFQSKNPLGAVISGMKMMARNQGLHKTAALLDFLIPFAGVPSSIAVRIIRRTPIGTANEIVKQVWKMKVTGEIDAYDHRKLAQAFAEGSAGVPIIGAGYALGQAGLLTGAYPTDKQERQKWTDKGIQENSIKIDGRYYSLNYIQPFGALLQVGAGISQADKAGKTGWDKAFTTGASSLKSFLGQSYLEGIQAPIDAINDPERAGERFVASTASSAVPNLIRSFATASDDKQRDASGIVDGVKSAVPGLRQTLNPKLDSQGRDLPSNDNFLNLFLNPLKPSKERGTDAVTSEAYRLLDTGNGITMSPDKKLEVKGETVPLTKDQQLAHNKAVGTMMNTQFDAIMKSPEYQTLDDAGKAKMLQNAANAVNAVQKQTTLNAIGKSDLANQIDLSAKEKRLAEGKATTKMFQPESTVSETPQSLSGDGDYVSFRDAADVVPASEKDNWLASEPEAEYKKLVDRANTTVPDGFPPLANTNATAKRYADFLKAQADGKWSQLQNQKETNKFVRDAYSDMLNKDDQFIASLSDKELLQAVEDGQVSQDSLNNIVALDDIITQLGGSAKLGKSARAKLGYGAAKGSGGSGGGGGGGRGGKKKIGFQAPDGAKYDALASTKSIADILKRARVS